MAVLEDTRPCDHALRQIMSYGLKLSILCSMFNFFLLL
ncbi:hypothetical protein J500_2447 [Acinetobacter sp. 479375]|nr:hypothetical protein J500_2447 [Acinetobacter sp. 479375]